MTNAATRSTPRPLNRLARHSSAACAEVALARGISCSANPTMLQAFNAAHYRYMDLIQMLADKRLELASKTDHGEMTDQQEQFELQRFNARIQAIERQRDSAPH